MNANKTTVGGSAVATTSKSNRLSSLLDQLDKLWPLGKPDPPDEKEIDHVRYVTNKLHQLLSSQEKCRKELLNKNPNAVYRLVTTLEVIAKWDLQATLNVVSCFNELLTSGKRIGALTDHELPEALFKTLVVIPLRDSAKDGSVAEELITILHAVFSKMGTKDKRFAVQARMTGALQVSLNVAKQNPQNFKVLHPVLQVLKIYANSPVNCNIMVKGGAIETLLKILPFCGQKRVLSAKIILEILAFLMKSKIGARRGVLQGAVSLLLSMFVDWHRTDHRHRQTALRRSILTVLKNIVMINSGRKALAQIDGMKVLYNIAMEGLECKELDGIIKLIILILRRCFARSDLPLRSNVSVLSYRLQSPVDTESSRENSEDDAIGMGMSDDDLSETKSKSEFQLDTDDNDDMNDDDESQETKDGYSEDNRFENSPMRERNDLEMYEEFVKEMLEFTVDANAINTLSNENAKGSPIRIPTATMESPVNFYSQGESSPVDQVESKGGYSRIKKSTSLDNNCILTERRAGNKNVILSSDSDNDVDITTTSVFDLGHFAPRSPFASLRRTRTPSMPSIPCQRTFTCGNVENVDFVVKGMRLQSSCGSSPSLKEFANKQYLTKTEGVYSDSETVERFEISRYGKTHAVSDALSSTELHQQNSFEGVSYETKHLLPFVKEATPSTHGHYPVIEPEPLLEKKPGLHRVMIFQDFHRFICPEKLINRVVFDLDDIINGNLGIAPAESIASSYLTSPKRTSLASHKSSGNISNLNDDALLTPVLHFESRFESGNLRKAIQIRPHEYDLLLNTDINSDHHCQWFYFEVSNMESDVSYKFNIINCEKFNSQFNFGMQPVMYSTKDAEEGQPGWERTGSNVCYYKNFYQRKIDGSYSNRYYFTTTFTIKFPHTDDVCYLAYHYPYTYTMLKAHILKLESRLASNIYYNNQILCFTLLGNECDVLTITERPNTDDPQSILAFRKRPYVLLTSRVHPGESCASWVSKGMLDFLLSNNDLAVRLRETFIFKIVPFLNPDGVINGNHRCSISGDDLNRQWISPDPVNHPTIYHTKGLMQYLNSVNKTPLVYCDFHGHSRRKNVFMYGCSVAATSAARQQGSSDTVFYNEGDVRAEGNNAEELDTNVDEDTGYKTLPRILNAIAPAFSIQSCSYVMEKSKEATARIVVFKELGILRSYTVESTYCGADQGPYKGNHFGTRELEEMGKNFCIGLLKLSQSYSIKLRHEYFREPCSYGNEKEDEKIDYSVKNDADTEDLNRSDDPDTEACEN